MMTDADVLTLYRQYNVAMAARDTATLDQLLAPDFTLTHMTGYQQPRAEWLAQIGDGTMGYVASKEHHVTVTGMADQTWRVVGQNFVTAAVYGGATQDWPLNTDMQVAMSNGQLQILSAVVTTF